MNEKQQFQTLVQTNIKEFGFHITLVTSDLEPRFAYTIGLNDLLGLELIFAGGIFYFKEDLFKIINTVAENLKTNSESVNGVIAIPTLGNFSLSMVNPSWSNLMMLGVFDYYETQDIKALQIRPSLDYYTLDIPDMSKKFDTSLEPIWKWLVEKWDYNAPANSTVVTNLDALMGSAITEVMRWDSNEWEMFAGAGPDVEEKDIRVVSLGTILGIDKSLAASLDLSLGKGLWRDAKGVKWNNWG